MAKKQIAHDDLAASLALAKGGVPFLNVCLGSPWASKKTPRADLVVCNPSLTRFVLSIFEIKVSRADFLSDIRSEKWLSYLPHCHRFYFAALEGVCAKADMPPEAGLLLHGPKGWRAVKRAKSREVEIPHQTLLSLVLMRQHMTERERRLQDVANMAEEQDRKRCDWYTGRLYAAKVLGQAMGEMHEAAMQVGGLEKATQILKDAKPKPGWMG